MVIDVTMFNGEYDLFEIRYNILKPFVDQFIVCEAKTTFSGKPKQLYFPKGKYPDVKYYVIKEDYSDKEIEQAQKSPNTQGAEHWKHEFLQKESIKKALTHLNDDDIIFISDCDEIWNPKIWIEEKLLEALKKENYKIVKLPHKVYTYYLNNLSSEKWNGTIMSTYKAIQEKCLNHVRSIEHIKVMYSDNSVGGWHFTSMRHDLKRKLEDSYTEETYATPQVMANLEQNIQSDKDFLGRDFTYTEDESDWPPWLKEHRLDYLHLLK